VNEDLFAECSECQSAFSKSLVACPQCQTFNSVNFSRCKNCGATFAIAAKQCPDCGLFQSYSTNLENDQFIYILINRSMRDIVKIGKTNRDPKERAAELSNATGVPSEFVVAFVQAVSDCDSAERAIHQRLQAFRENKDREFFRLPLKDAISTVLEVCKPFIPQR